MYGPGFSCVGLIFLLMLFVPKILWAKRRPAAFFLLGVYGRNALMLVAVAMLGVGHIGIHLQHRREALGEGGPT